MKPFLRFMPIMLLFPLAYSCCDTCDLHLSQDQLAWFPYQQGEEIRFSSESGDTLHFMSSGIQSELEEKDCDRVLNEKICHLTDTQVLENTDQDLKSDYRIEFSVFKDAFILLDIQFITRENQHPYAGVTISTDHLSDEFVPDYPDYSVNNQVYHDVYSAEGTNDPLIPEGLNDVVDFLFTMRDGLIQFRTRDDKVWNRIP